MRWRRPAPPSWTACRAPRGRSASGRSPPHRRTAAASPSSGRSRCISPTGRPTRPRSSSTARPPTSSSGTTSVREPRRSTAATSPSSRSRTRSCPSSAWRGTARTCTWARRCSSSAFRASWSLTSCSAAPPSTSPRSRSGRVSGFKRDIGGQRVIQTDAAIIQGNSGGPVFDDRGQVIGAATFTSLQGEQVVQGFNFLIPVETIQEAAAKAGVVPRGDSMFTRLWNHGVDLYIRDLHYRAYTQHERREQDPPGLPRRRARARGLRHQAQGAGLPPPRGRSSGA